VTADPIVIAIPLDKLFQSVHAVLKLLAKMPLHSRLTKLKFVVDTLPVVTEPPPMTVPLPSLKTRRPFMLWTNV
jgi:hypothetical protein